MKRNVALNMHQTDLSLPNPPAPGGSYTPVNVRANIAYVAIQFPIKNNRYLFQGRLGKNLGVEAGYEAAELCALNILSQVNYYTGLHRVAGLNHLDIYLQQAPGWDEAPHVADGASDFFLKILGSRGQHARAIVGVHSLPRNFCVGITASFTLEATDHPVMTK